MVVEVAKFKFKRVGKFKIPKFIFPFITAALLLSQRVSCQTFIHDCNNPNILKHELHTYCAHACLPNPEQTAICAPSGNCLCHQPCYDKPEDAMMGEEIGSDICPPLGTDPTDPDVQAVTDACDAACPKECPGGNGGTICGELQPFNDPMMRPIVFTTICACVCPAQQCPPPVTTTTTTTAAPIVTSTSPRQTIIQIVNVQQLPVGILKLMTILKIMLIWIWDWYKISCKEIAHKIYMELIEICISLYLDINTNDLDLFPTEFNRDDIDLDQNDIDLRHPFENLEN